LQGEYFIESMSFLQKIEEVIEEYTEIIENSNDVTERKKLLSERKTPKQVYEWIERKQKY
jgi:hypothetical protein